MKTFEVKEYKDVDGDELQVDCHNTHVEISIYSSTGSWPCADPMVLRDLAAQLVRGAEQLEIEQ